MPIFNKLLFKSLITYAVISILLISPFQTFAQQEGKLRGMGHQRVLNEFIVVLDSGYSHSLEETGQHLAQTHQGQYLGKYETLNAVYLNIAEERIEKLSKQPEVLYVEANIFAEPASLDWGLDRLTQRSLPLDGLGSHGMGGLGQSIYMVDSGINFDHELFAGKASNFWDFDAGNAGFDCYGHGTHTAGIAAQTVPHADIKAVRVFNCAGSAPLSTVLAGLDAIYYTGTPNSAIYIGIITSGSSSLDASVQNLINAGFHAVVPAGNTSSDASLFSPARVADAITVTSINTTDSFSSFSNYGAVIDMIAPGESIVSALLPNNDTYDVMTGTSQSAAYAAAVLTGYLAQGRTVNDFLGSSTYINGYLLPYLDPATAPPATPKISIDYTVGEAGFRVKWFETTGASLGNGTPSYYVIQENIGGTGWSGDINVGPNGYKNYVNQPSGTHSFKAQACNPTGCSLFSSAQSVEVNAAPDLIDTIAIDYVDVKNLDVSSGDFTIEWSSSGETATRYEIIKNYNEVDGPITQVIGSLNNTYLNQPAGTYQYRVRACTDEGCSIYRDSAFFTIKNISINTAVNAIEPTIGTEEAVGITGGQFRVNESGAATYSVSLNLPAGVAGVKPQVSLNYSSQGSDSVMGRGWSVGVGGAITRCPKNPYHNSGEISPIENGGDDRFCLDGLQLMASDIDYGIDGTSYYTTTESFSKITSHGGSALTGPDSFTVETKSGDTYYYGNHNGGGSDAYVEPNSHPTAGTNLAKFWALKKVVDVKDNTIIYNYNEDTTNGTHYLDEIVYGGNERLVTSNFNRIKFNYISNPKMKAAYSVTSNLLMDQLLDNINITVNGKAYRTYKFDYFSTEVIEELNYLESITECTSGTDCLKPLSFTWERPAAIETTLVPVEEIEPEPNGGEITVNFLTPQTENYQPFSATTTQIGADNSNGRKHSRMFDINADGYADIISEHGGWDIRYGPTYDTVFQDVSNIGSSDSVRDYALNIDYDGDGQMDLLVANGEDFNDKWHVLSHNPSVGTHLATGNLGLWPQEVPDAPIFIEKNLQLPAYGLEGEAHVMDVNGDGLQDIVYAYNNKLMVYKNGDGGVKGEFSAGAELIDLDASSTYKFSESLVEHSPGESSSAMIDVNGDGRSDFLTQVTKNSSHWYCEINGQQEPLYQQQSICEENEIGGIWKQSIANHVSWELFVSDGDMANPNYSNRKGIPYDGDNLRATDLNGDGLTDVVFRLDGNDTWYYALSNGYEFGPVHKTSHTSPDTETHHIFFMDLNGDGRADILKPDTSSTWRILLSRPTAFPDTIIWESRGVLSRDTDDSILFGDVDGDGKMDILTASNNSGWHVRYNARQGIVDNVITEFNNGWGVKTTVTYSSLMDPEVNLYNDFIDDDKPDNVIVPVGPRPVVKRVESDSAESSRVSVSYQYGGMLLDTQGLGSLGFRELITTDEESTIQTSTIYRQDYPFIGMPKETRQLLPNGATGITLSESNNEYISVPSAGQGGVYAYLSKSTESSYTLSLTDGELGTSSQFISKTITENTNDNWGNLATSKVQQFSDSDATQLKLLTLTKNTYEGNGGGAEKGRLSETIVTKSLSDIDTSCDGTPNCRRSSFEYEDSGLLKKSIISEDGMSFPGVEKLATEYTYDGFGHKNSITKTGGRDGTTSNVSNVTSSLYSSDGRFLLSTTNGVTGTTTYSYKDVIGNEHTASFDIGPITEVKTTTENSASVTSYLNAWGHSMGKATAAAPTAYTDTQYCAGSCTANAYYYSETTQLGSPTKRVEFDKFGRELVSMVKDFDDIYIYAFKDYDTQGRLSREYLPTYDNYRSASSSDYTKYNYDIFNRVISIEMPNYNALGYSQPKTNYSGLTTTRYDAKGYSTSETKNALGQLVSVTDEKGGVLSYTYDVYGKLLTAVKSADGVDITQVTNTYNSHGQKESTTDIDKGAWSYVYNDFGQIVSQTDANLNVITTEYDDYGRKTRQSSSDFTQCWAYGTDAGAFEKGKLVETLYFDGTGSASCVPTSFSQRTEIDYDQVGRAFHTKQTVNDIASPLNGEYHTYKEYSSTTGKLQKQHYPGLGFSIENEYTSTGYLKALKDVDTGTVYQEITGTNERGQTTSVTYGNGVVEAIGYNDQTGHVTSHDVNSGVVHSLDYTYDSVGNLDSRQHTLGIFSNNTDYKEEYTYDNLHRLINREVTIGTQTQYSMDESYAYDGFGNFTKKGDSKHYKYDGNKKLLGVYDNASFSGAASYDFVGNYDSNGNITNDGNRALTYSTFNKVTDITEGTSQSEFTYGMGHKRYYRHDKRIVSSEQVDTHTAYLDGLEKIYRTGTDDDLLEYKFYAGNVVITKRSDQMTQDDNDEFYLHKDHLGSPLSITNKDGLLVEQNVYDPWGKVHQLAIDDNRLGGNLLPTTRGYTGHEGVKGLDIIHMNGRIYDPTLGRFLQADPHIQAPTNSQNYNRYSYVLNNPLSYTDPSGYFFSGLRKKIKKYWKPIVAAVAAYYTFGAVQAWAANSTFWSGAASITASGNAITAAQAISIANTSMTVGAVAGGAAAGAVSGAIMTGSLKGAAQGAIVGAAGGYASSFAGSSSRVPRGLSGGMNGAMESGDIEGFAKGALAAQLNVDLGIDAYYTNEGANFLINRASSYGRGYIIGGSRTARRNMYWGIANDVIGHSIGRIKSYSDYGKVYDPVFRNGMYYYPQKTELQAISFGNVITGPKSLYNNKLDAYAFNGAHLSDLDAHERAHFFEQSYLGPYYTPIHAVAVISGLSGGTPWLDCKGTITTTYENIRSSGC